MNLKKQSFQFFVIYAAGALLLAVDFAIKAIANRTLPYQETVATALPFLHWYRTHNTGYHFILGNIGNHQLWAIIGLFFVILLIGLLSRSFLRERLSRSDRIIYMLLIPLMIGASGNVLEVLIMGHATDYFVFRPLPWPSNISDQYINAIIYIMMPIMIIKSILDKRHQKGAESQEPSAESPAPPAKETD